MSDSPTDLDLKFLPDWLKESSTGNRYENYEGDTGDRPRRDDRGPRPGGDRRSGPPPRRDRPPGGDRGGPRPGPGGGGQRPGGRRPDGPRGDQRQDRRDSAPPPPPQKTAEVRVEFLPEQNCVAGIAKQIRSSHRAYPLFGTARLFLEKPERHRVRITSLDATIPLFQCGDGPVSFDQTGVERAAFRQMKDEFYAEEQIQGEPLKGNFTNVARSRTSGIFLGPTNYHGYQPALRKLYEERFSRRMSYPEFLRDEVQILNNEQAVADWKEQARSSTTFTTKTEAEPVSFKTLAEVEQHFRQTYLPKLVKSGTTLETSGHASRAIVERGILATLRDVWERERGFPQSLVNQLRPHLVEIGLHFFKHRKRILYVTPIRPQRHTAGENFSEGIGSILTAVNEHPKITRPQLAVRLLGEGHDAPEALPRKAALASDLHYLVQAGHVIEFHDGTLDLPLAPNAKPEPEGQEESKQAAKQAPEAGPSMSNPVENSDAPEIPEQEPAVVAEVPSEELPTAPSAEPQDEPISEHLPEPALPIEVAGAAEEPIAPAEEPVDTAAEAPKLEDEPLVEAAPAELEEIAVPAAEVASEHSSASETEK